MKTIVLVQVLPVLFQHLPLGEDFAEAQSVFTCLHLLYEKHFAEVNFSYDHIHIDNQRCFSIRSSHTFRNVLKWLHQLSTKLIYQQVDFDYCYHGYTSIDRYILDAVTVIRDFLRSIYTKHASAFVHVTQTLSEPLQLILTKHLQAN
jgi:hypothetical protein